MQCIKVGISCLADRVNYEYKINLVSLYKKKIYIYDPTIHNSAMATLIYRKCTEVYLSKKLLWTAQEVSLYMSV